MKKRFLALFLAIIMVVSLFPVTAFAEECTKYVSASGNDATGTGAEDAPFATIQKAIDSIPNSGTVILLSDLNVSTAASNNYAFEILDGKDITLDGGGYKVKMTSAVRPFCVSVGKLTLTDVDIDMNGHQYDQLDDGKYTIQVLQDGELVLNDGAIIENAKYGDGFTNFSIRGTATMNDGAIIRNMEGLFGAIRVEGYDDTNGFGNFYMNGGLITGCTSESYGYEGVVFYISVGGKMVMTGGTITGNQNKANSPGTIFLHANNMGARGYNEFTATGGTITGNSAIYGGVVYTNNNVNKINISGKVNFTGNTGTEFGGESNLYLGSDLLVNLEGGMGENSMVGVYTSSVPSNTADVKFAFNAAKADAGHFISDKMSTSGIIYDDGEKCWNAAGNEIIGYHHVNEANTLWLSTAAAGYAVDISSEIEHGTVTPNLKCFCPGDTVTLTVTPNDGYKLKSLKYNDGTTDYDITKDETTGKYQFTMPAKAVTVTATFEAAPTTYTITNGTTEDDKETNHGSISIDKTTAAEGETVTITVNPNDGYKLKSLTVTPAISANATFKAVYNTKDSANTLTFYYDAVDHSGEGITVYEGSTGDNYLFDNAKSNGAKWGYNSIRSSVKSVKIDSSVAEYKGLTSTAFMFQGMTIATDISGAESLDVSNVTDMSYMFQNFGGGKSGSPTTLNVVPDVSKWNTGNVTNMTAMFESYGNFSSSLDKVPDVSGWNTGKVTDMTFMFQKYGHESQNFNAVPDVSKWNTANVTSMKQMFCEYGHKSTALNTVPAVSNWNTGKVTNMQQMFYEYGSKSTNISCVLDLSGWDLSKITGTNGVNVFKFNPKTFNVTIPATTGAKSNESDKWYYGDETNFITPPEGKNFTPAANKLLKSSAPKQLKSPAPAAPKAIAPAKQQDGTYQFTMPAANVTVTAEFEEKAITIADILPDDFPTCVDVLPPNLWVNGNEVNMMVIPYSLVIFTLDGDGNPDYVTLADDIRTATLTKNGNNYTYTNNGVTTTFLMSDNGLESVKIEGLTGKYVDFNGTYGEQHAHTFTYAANNGKITATCTAGCDKGYDTTPLTLTLTAPASLVYDGNAKAFTFADGEADAWIGAGLELPTIIYQIKQSGQSTYMPLLGTLKSVGNYMAQITVNEKTAQVEFAIGKATPYIKTNPEPTDIVYGKKLSDSTLVGGYVQISSTNTTQVGGLFEWKLGDTIPALSDSETTEYDVTFTPTDTNNYNTVSCKVKIKVTHTHNPVKVTGQAATETAAGWSDYYECKDSTDACHKYFEDATAKVEITDLNAWKAQDGRGYIAPLVHSITPVSGKNATDTEAGYKPYYECKNCGKYYEDATGLIEITDLSAWKAKGGNGYIPSGNEINAAKIGTTPYASLADAISEVKNGETITLTKDTDERIVISREVSFKIDSNGFNNNVTIIGGKGYLVRHIGNTYIVVKVVVDEDERMKDVIILSGGGTEKGEENPNTGAEVPGIFSAIAVLAGAAFLLSKKR